jgi:NAD(P)-dependent dehydrogenase (short-subunit alcohol dehydrogenase family)
MKHVVITGAADGIGRALAHRFAQAGYEVTGVDVDVKRAADVERELDARFVVADLSLDAGVKQVFAVALCELSGGLGLCSDEEWAGFLCT